jgi:hypothetical protein
MPYLDLFMKAQKKSYYCYAAVAQAIVLYYTGAKVSQRSVAATFGTKGHQDPAEYLVPLDLLRVKSDTHYGHVGIVPWNTVVTEINGGRPIIVYVGGCHYALLIGYEGKEPRDAQRAYIFLDPLEKPPAPRLIPYAVLKDTGYPIEDTWENIRGYYLTSRP